MALRWANDSSLVRMSLGSSELFLVAHALLMMRSSVNWFSSTGLGPFMMKSTVVSFTFTTLSMPCVYTA